MLLSPVDIRQNKDVHCCCPTAMEVLITGKKHDGTGIVKNWLKIDRVFAFWNIR